MEKCAIRCCKYSWATLLAESSERFRFGQCWSNYGPRLSRNYGKYHKYIPEILRTIRNIVEPSNLVQHMREKSFQGLFDLEPCQHFFRVDQK